MRLSILPLVLAIGVAFVGVHGNQAQGLPPAPAPTCAGESVTVVHDTDPVCNCSGAPGKVRLCHSKKVTIEVGGAPLTVSTGQSNEACFEQVKNHGECLYWRYVFDCCYSWWSGWKCSLRESQAKSTTSECDV